MPILQDHGDYHYRAGDVDHINDLVSIANLQDAARNKNKSAYDMFAKAPDDQVRKCCLCGMVEFRSIDKNHMVPKEEVQPAGNIVGGNIEWVASPTLAREVKIWAVGQPRRTETLRSQPSSRLPLVALVLPLLQPLSSTEGS